MKYLMIIALAMLIACEEENPNSSDENISEIKYTIEELENDTNWLKITDIDAVNISIFINYFKNEKDYSKTVEYNSNAIIISDTNELVSYLESFKLEKSDEFDFKVTDLNLS